MQWFLGWFWTMQTSRSGRIRYKPLAFWMRETKVHDKQGGAIAIQRPAGTQTPPLQPKPTHPSQPGACPLGHAHSKPLPASQPKLASQSQLSSQLAPRLQDSEAETQSESHSQAEPPAYECTDDEPVSRKLQKQLSVQHSRRHRAAILPHTAPVPQDPPSPPFPYPILAGKGATVSKATVGPGSKQHKAESTGQPAVSTGQPGMQEQATANRKTSAKGATSKPETMTSGPLCAQTVARAAAKKKSKIVAALGVDTSSEAPSAAAAVSAAGSGKLHKCGTCKTCMQPQLKKGCMVLKALRDQLQAAADAAVVTKTPLQPVKQSKPAAMAKANKASQSVLDNESRKTSHSGQNSKQHKLAKAAKSVAAAQPGEAGTTSKADRQTKGKRSAGLASTSKGSAAPQGSIHSALTQAVELAFNMQESGAEEQQQEAAQVLDSLKNSPIMPSRTQPAVSGLPTAAPGAFDAGSRALSDQAMSVGEDPGSLPALSPSKRGRGRPRKERKPGDDTDSPNFGPKRSRGRPRKHLALPDSSGEPSSESQAAPVRLPSHGGTQDVQLASHAMQTGVSSGSTQQKSSAAEASKAAQPLSSGLGKTDAGTHPEVCHHACCSSGSTRACHECRACLV